MYSSQALVVVVRMTCVCARQRWVTQTGHRSGTRWLKQGIRINFISSCNIANAPDCDRPPPMGSLGEAVNPWYFRGWNRCINRNKIIIVMRWVECSITSIAFDGSECVRRRACTEYIGVQPRNVRIPLYVPPPPPPPFPNTIYPNAFHPIVISTVYTISASPVSLSVHCSYTSFVGKYNGAVEEFPLFNVRWTKAFCHCQCDKSSTNARGIGQRRSRLQNETIMYIFFLLLLLNFVIDGYNGVGSPLFCAVCCILSKWILLSTLRLDGKRVSKAVGSPA